MLFYPRNADKVQLLSWADLVLLPSSREGLPLVSLEAQAGKTRCLLSDRVPREADRGAAVFLPYNDLGAMDRGHCVGRFFRGGRRAAPECGWASFLFGAYPAGI